MDTPFSHCLPHGLGGAVAGSRAECDKVPAVPILGYSRSEGVPQEVKFLIGVTALSLAVFAIDDACLVQIQFELAVFQSLDDLICNQSCFLTCFTMNHN